MPSAIAGHENDRTCTDRRAGGRRRGDRDVLGPGRRTTGRIERDYGRLTVVPSPLLLIVKTPEAVEV